MAGSAVSDVIHCCRARYVNRLGLACLRLANTPRVLLSIPCTVIAEACLESSDSANHFQHYGNHCKCMPPGSLVTHILLGFR
jgi:hypothetical protein